MSFRKLFPERGTYDVTPPLTELQERCNNLTSVITTSANSPTGSTSSNVPPPVLTPTPSPSTLPMPPTSSPTEFMQRERNLHVDAIVEIAPDPNIGFQSFEVDNRSQKSGKDAASTTSRGSKCEDCMVNCLYYSNECCDCTIV